VIDIEVVKRRLHVVHDADDEMIQQILDGAEDEARTYMNRSELPTLPQDWPESEGEEEVPSSDDPVAPSVVEGICLLVMAGYGATTGDEMLTLRNVALRKLDPYRIGLGV
jgi:hypothetical protein